MNAIRATWKEGQVVVEEAVDWPEGCPLEVRPLAVNDSKNDDVESNDPAVIARWIVEFERISPLEMTAEEAAAWQAARQVQRDFELKTFDERADQIQKALK